MCAGLGRLMLQKTLDVPPSQFILGAQRDGEENGDDLDDDATVCACHVSLVAS